MLCSKRRIIMSGLVWSRIFIRNYIKEEGEDRSLRRFIWGQTESIVIKPIPNRGENKIKQQGKNK
jgi:hypothetical protein